jgi:hypothetical protein
VAKRGSGGTTTAAQRVGTFRGIDDLAALVGAYCWVEDRVFNAAGRWACAPETAQPDLTPEVRVFAAALSRRHGVLAQRWAERLPVRTGVDGRALVGAPSRPLEEAFRALMEAPTSVGVGTLVAGVLPRLRDVYEAHWRSAPAVSEAPVLEVLVDAHRVARGEISSGEALLGAMAIDANETARLVQKSERAFGSGAVFPAVPPS